MSDLLIVYGLHHFNQVRIQQENNNDHNDHNENEKQLGYQVYTQALQKSFYLGLITKKVGIGKTECSNTLKPDFLKKTYREATACIGTIKKEINFKFSETNLNTSWVKRACPVPGFDSGWKADFPAFFINMTTSTSSRLMINSITVIMRKKYPTGP